MTAIPFSEWPTDAHARWVQAGNTFGRHLMAAARDYALKRLPQSAPPEVRQAAEQAALDAIYGTMMLLDGVADARIDGSHPVEYVLLARIRQSKQPQAVEEIELAPGGDGLCVGFHGWAAGDFGNA